MHESKLRRSILTMKSQLVVDENYRTSSSAKTHTAYNLASMSDSTKSALSLTRGDPPSRVFEIRGLREDIESHDPPRISSMYTASSRAGQDMRPSAHRLYSGVSFNVVEQTWSLVPVVVTVHIRPEGSATSNSLSLSIHMYKSSQMLEQPG